MKNVTNYASIARLALFFAIITTMFAFSEAHAQQNQTNIYPDEYSILDEDKSNIKVNNTLIKNTLIKSRKQYLRALDYIHRDDTLRAKKYFEEALRSLNRIVSYPGIEENTEFSELVSMISEDYESYIPGSEMNDNASLLGYKEKLFEEIEEFTAKSNPDIQTIDIPVSDKVQGTIAGVPVGPDSLQIPVDADNVLVQKNIDFLTKNRFGINFRNKVLSRSTRWFPMYKRIAKELGAPEELAYLSMVESGLNPNAVSRAKAVGLWQFMRATGKENGLNVNNSPWVDERRDPEKSTRAAMKHLQYLYMEFGDWHLAMAAYNCGMGCVRRALRRYGKKDADFWDLALSKKRRYFVRETKNYVPLYIAVTRIAMNPEAYGVDPSELEFQEEYKYDTYRVKESVHLSAIAKCVGVPDSVVKELNPELIRNFTPADREYYDVKIPRGSKDMIAMNFPQLTDEEKRPFIYHQVKRRETITKIARKYGVNKRELAKFNGFKSYRSRLKRGGMVKVPVSDLAMESVTQVDMNRATMRNGKKLESDLYHTVKRGETLFRIAQEYGIRLDQLRSLNDLSSKEDNIQPGSKLLIAKADVQPKVEENKTDSKNDVAKSSNIAENKNTKTVPNHSIESSDNTSPKINKIESTKVFRHKVKRGESLASISRDYGVSIASIKEANRLPSSRIKSGQILKIESSREKAQNLARVTKGEHIIHKIRRGQTVSTIAARYGVKVSDLKSWNPGKINGTAIVAGDRLKIYPNKYSKGSAKSDSKKVNRSPKTYRVRKGDTFEKIARKFGVSIKSLQRKNRGVNPKRLQIGQKIRIQ